MADLNEVIAGLEQCYYGKCTECPYEFHSDMSCNDALLVDALKLLRGPEVAAVGVRDEVMWLCCTGGAPVGIVKHYDETEKRWKFYIGTGKGEDLDEDVQRILAMGQKFYSLDFIQSFAEVQEDEG